MDDHDPLCVAHGSRTVLAVYACQCVIIGKTRADERDALHAKVEALEPEGLLIWRDAVLALLGEG